MINKKILWLAVIAALLIIATQSCVEPYELDYTLSKRIIIVDGVLTDNPLANNYVVLKEAIPSGAQSYFVPITKAVVEVVVNDKERFLLTETEEGTYQKNNELIISDKNTYRLEFKTTDGRSYQSADESFKAGNPISNVYTKLELEGLAKSNDDGYEPAHALYLDTKDAVGKGNNYVWSWTLFEKQNICETCVNGRYFYDSRKGNGCRTELSQGQTEYYYDYNCDLPCWQVFKNTQINVLTDNYVDGQPIIGRLVAKIPIYQLSGALVEVRQQSVSIPAFRYLKLLTEQSQSNGGLADTPPAALIGNVKNTNDPEEITGGFFMVASEDVRLFWISREDAISQNLSARGLLGHPLILEPTTTPSRPPLVQCVNSTTRTNKKPKGWVN